MENGAALGEFTNLILEKFENSISTLSKFPKNHPNRDTAMIFIRRQQEKLRRRRDLSISDILGIEGETAANYFEVWR